MRLTDNFYCCLRVYWESSGIVAQLTSIPVDLYLFCCTKPKNFNSIYFFGLSEFNEIILFFGIKKQKQNKEKRTMPQCIHSLYGQERRLELAHVFSTSTVPTAGFAPLFRDYAFVVVFK